MCEANCLFYSFRNKLLLQNSTRDYNMDSTKAELMNAVVN